MDREWKPHTRHHRRHKDKQIAFDTPPKGLVLARFVGDAIVIGDNITITVIACDNNRVKLCIDAPKEIPVDRAEIRQLKQNS